MLLKQKEADVLLFLEDVDGKNAKSARLSFSTKTTDYLSSGRCIFAIGNEDLAPIEYLKENKSAIVATCDMELEASLTEIINNPSILVEYAKNSAEPGIKNHTREKIEQNFYGVISEVYGKAHNR